MQISELYVEFLWNISTEKINPGFSPQAYPRLKLSWKLRSSKIFSNNIEIQISRCPRGYSILPPLAVERYFFQQRNVWRCCLYIHVLLNRRIHIYNTSNKVFSREFDLKSSILPSVYKLTKVFCVVSLNRICWGNLILFSSLLFDSLCVRNWVIVSSL